MINMKISGWFIFKVVIVLLALFEIGMFGYIFYSGRLQSKEYSYCGIILDKGYEPPTSGYKSHHDAVYYVIMKENVSGKGIRVNVNVPTYYSLNKGSNTCFTISNYSLYYYGNTQDKSKNLYGK